VWFIKSFKHGNYHNFRDYTTKYKFLMIDKERNQNNKYKVMIDEFIAYMRELFGQFVCSECFCYYSKKYLIVTHEPYTDYGMESEGSPFYCSDECVEYRAILNEQYLEMQKRNSENT